MTCGGMGEEERALRRRAPTASLLILQRWSRPATFSNTAI
jgi:hypothetical protein